MWHLNSCLEHSESRAYRFGEGQGREQVFIYWIPTLCQAPIKHSSFNSLNSPLVCSHSSWAVEQGLERKQFDSRAYTIDHCPIRSSFNPPNPKTLLSTIIIRSVFQVRNEKLRKVIFPTYTKCRSIWILWSWASKSLHLSIHPSPIHLLIQQN